MSIPVNGDLIDAETFQAARFRDWTETQSA